MRMRLYGPCPTHRHLRSKTLRWSGLEHIHLISNYSPSTERDPETCGRNECSGGIRLTVIMAEPWLAAPTTNWCSLGQAFFVLPPFRLYQFYSWNAWPMRVVVVVLQHPPPPSLACRWNTLSMVVVEDCLLYTSPSPRDLSTSRMPSSA